jgi:hypothetical protein
MTHYLGILSLSENKESDKICIVASPNMFNADKHFPTEYIS